MYHYYRIDLSEGIDLTKCNNTKGCIVCHYWYFNHGFKSQKTVCNGCHGWKCCLNFSDIAIIAAKGVTYRRIIHGIIKYKAICLFENPVLDDRGYV